MKNRYFTKSKFALAMECPTKLYYHSKADEYANQKIEDSFLQALAENGLQVGQLAKCYYGNANSIDLTEFTDEEAIVKTQELLLSDEVTIFEAAFLHKNLFLRADILVKNLNHIKLIEVKSASAIPEKSSDTSIFMNKKKNKLLTEWEPYILDIAFQKLVLQKIYPNFNISAYLMLIDKSSTCPSEGLNQKFKIKKDIHGKTIIITSAEITSDDLSTQILHEFSVDNEVKYIYENKQYRNNMSFNDYIFYLAEMYAKSEKISPIPGKICASCEFNTSGTSNLKSGFQECWSQIYGFTSEDFQVHTVLNIWNYRKKDELLLKYQVRLSQIEESNIKPKSDGKPGWSTTQRQWLQVQKGKNNDLTPELHKELKYETEKWIYPLHFIDFETTMPAIPFTKGAHPYQGIAFQFSHHILHENGKVEHASQFINDQVGINPNLNLVRALMNSLNKDNGSIFRYHNHENTYLNYICEEITNNINHIEDKEEIINFIKDITKSSKKSKVKWKGKRCMIDLCALVQRYYYDPLTFGSISIKKIFPAILQRSKFLQEKYNKPIYGAENEIVSQNFKNMQWVKIQNGTIIDPYQLLPPLFADIDLFDKDIDLLFKDTEIKGGGAASMAYLRMQFTEMSHTERRALIEALLKYCELDTLAMVMIVEAWLDMLRQK